MAKSKRMGSRVVALGAAADALVLARPRLVKLAPEQEREAVRLLADLLAAAASRGRRPELRQAA